RLDAAMHGEDGWRTRRHGHRNQLGYRVDALWRMGVDYEGRRRNQQRVPVGRRRGDVLGADQTARAAPVLDDHRLPQLLAHFLANGPADGVGDPAWRE